MHHTIRLQRLQVTYGIDDVAHLMVSIFSPSPVAMRFWRHKRLSTALSDGQSTTWFNTETTVVRYIHRGFIRLDRKTWPITSLKRISQLHFS